MQILGKDDNLLDNFGPYEDNKSIPEAQDIESDHKDLVGESSDTESHAKIRRTPQNGLLGSELSSFPREVRFSE